jgi:tRNA threonylcarbamoyl adenosine modification protein (Sua5/YciO/YrdC/YwlC family)
MECLCYGLFPSSHGASFGGIMAEILKLDNSSFDYVLKYTVHLILRGKVVAFPTDTFYGLGADPFNLAAISEIFRVKRRVADRPIPLLVDSVEQAAELTDRPPQLFFTLAQKFWPGPLTLVVPASSLIPLKVTANTGKVGLRWPMAPFVVALIAAAGRPLTGTSANLSDMDSCSTADEVDCQIGDVLPLILDGGLTRGGLASTVVELTGETGRIVRPGGVPESELKEYLG